METKLKPETIKILSGCVSRLTHECVDWYQEAGDGPTLDQMTADEVEAFVREFLRAPDWYRAQRDEANNLAGGK